MSAEYTLHRVQRAAYRHQMTTELVEYSFQGERAMVPRCAHEEIERLKGELEQEKLRRRNRESALQRAGL